MGETPKTLNPVHREEEGWLNRRSVCKLIVSTCVSFNQIAELLTLFLPSAGWETSDTRSTPCCSSSSGASSSLALRWPGTSGTSSWVCASSSCRTSELPARWPNDRSAQEVCVLVLRALPPPERCLQLFTRTHRCFFSFPHGPTPILDDRCECYF